ncbi:MAG: hypothetical protein LLG13_04365 [Bacteroidales bacterium]|nr:hypothetical protein [Bacteroidales bacterium]
MKRVIFLLVLVSGMWFAVNGQEFIKPVSTNVINVKKINRDIIVDGNFESKEWALVDSITGFLAPWSPVGKDRTVFKYFCSDTYFNFGFSVNDNTMTTCEIKEEYSVAGEDRVELYFNARPDWSEYYCVEMDPLGNKLDYIARYHRIFDFSWKFNKVDISAHYTPEGYVVEGRIPLSDLEKLGIKEFFYLAVFRADFWNGKEEDAIWYSWIKPQSETPDFHIPSSFGFCNFPKR